MVKDRVPENGPVAGFVNAFEPTSNGGPVISRCFEGAGSGNRLHDMVGSDVRDTCSEIYKVQCRLQLGGQLMSEAAI